MILLFNVTFLFFNVTFLFFLNSLYMDIVNLVIQNKDFLSHKKTQNFDWI